MKKETKGNRPDFAELPVPRVIALLFQPQPCTQTRAHLNLRNRPSSNLHLLFSFRPKVASGRLRHIGR